MRLFVIGASTGGMHALQVILSRLGPDLPAAIAIVQHRGAGMNGRLIDLLARHTRMPIHEAEDKQPLRPGHAYLAPADYHMLVAQNEIVLSVDDRVSCARPSIDVLFESAAYAYGPAVVAVALTSASDDGADGAAQVKAAGGLVLVQDPAEALNPVLPRAVLERVDAEILPLSMIAGRLAQICGQRRS